MVCLVLPRGRALGRCTSCQHPTPDQLTRCPVAAPFPATDNPFAGGNSFDCTVGGGQACQQAIACTLSGGGGNNAVLSVNIGAK